MGCRVLLDLVTKQQQLISSRGEVKLLSRVQLCDPVDVACQASLSMGFPSQEYWSGSPFPWPGGFPDPGIEPGSSSLQADSLPSEHLVFLKVEQFSHFIFYETDF